MVSICASIIDVFRYMRVPHCACVKSTFPHAMPSQIASIKHVLRHVNMFLNQNLWVVYLSVCVCCLHVCPVLMLHFYWVSVSKKVSYRQYQRINTHYCIELKIPGITHLVFPSHTHTPLVHSKERWEFSCSFFWGPQQKLWSPSKNYYEKIKRLSDEGFNYLSPRQPSLYTALGCLSLVGFMSTWYSQPSYWYS